MASSFSDQLRRSIRTSGLTAYRLAKESGVEQSSLSRFMRAEHGLSTESLDKIARVIRMGVVSKGPTQRVLRKAKGGRS